MRIYTRTGDSGSTGLFGGDRVTKRHPRLVAYGTLDELNSVIGLLRLHANPEAASPTTLQQIQNDLFVLGALLATPESRLDQLGERMKKPTWGIEEMEKDIDRLTAISGPMRAFVLPGGCAGASWGHLARTVCRRAEREVVAMMTEEPVDELVLRYLNRLSDWLFALSRAENTLAGSPDIEWNP